MHFNHLTAKSINYTSDFHSSNSLLKESCVFLRKFTTSSNSIAAHHLPLENSKDGVFIAVNMCAALS
jgi:hypothetical protein